jgi:transcriptional regulator with XRE-family HTH domain
VTDVEHRVVLGRRIRELRKQRGLTLAELGARIELTASSLSKVEKGNVSISFDALTRLASGLTISVSELFEIAEPKTGAGRLSINRSGEGRIYETTAYVYEMLCANLLHKRMVPIRTTIKLGSPAEFGPLLRHSGEEFIYVLGGSVRVLTELYEPVELNAGDSVYLDSSMAHGVIHAAGQDQAEVIWVSLGSEPVLEVASVKAKFA